MPPGPAEKWTSPPFVPVERKGRLYGRGTADDKGGFLAWVAAASAYLGAAGRVPVNLKFLIEGEEEVGSTNLSAFLDRYRSKLDADVVVLSDTYNFATGVPALTWQLRGLVQVDVEVTCLDRPVHSGDFGGAVPDPVRILCRLLDDLRAEDGRIDVPGLYRRVARPSPSVRRRLRRLPFSEAAFRRGAGMLPGTRLEREKGVSVYEQIWTRPSLTVIAIEAHPLHGSSNQILDSARARLSLRTVPDMDSGEAGALLVRKLTAKPPAGARVAARITRTTPWWTTEPEGPAFEAAMRALEKGYGRKPALIGSGASIGFVQPFADAMRRALPPHRRRGPGLRRALRGREPAPRRLEEGDALGRALLRRAGGDRDGRAEEQAALSRRRLPVAVSPCHLGEGSVGVVSAPASGEPRTSGSTPGTFGVVQLRRVEPRRQFDTGGRAWCDLAGDLPAVVAEVTASLERNAGDHRGREVEVAV